MIGGEKVINENKHISIEELANGERMELNVNWKLYNGKGGAIYA